MRVFSPLAEGDIIDLASVGSGRCFRVTDVSVVVYSPSSSLRHQTKWSDTSLLNVFHEFEKDLAD